MRGCRQSCEAGGSGYISLGGVGLACVLVGGVNGDVDVPDAQEVGHQAADEEH